jgi:hypothetical protein
MTNLDFNQDNCASGFNQNMFGALPLEPLQSGAPARHRKSSSQSHLVQTGTPFRIARHSPAGQIHGRSHRRFHSLSNYDPEIKVDNQYANMGSPRLAHSRTSSMSTVSSQSHMTPQSYDSQIDASFQYSGVAPPTQEFSAMNSMAQDLTLQSPESDLPSLNAPVYAHDILNTPVFADSTLPPIYPEDSAYASNDSLNSPPFSIDALQNTVFPTESQSYNDETAFNNETMQASSSFFDQSFLQQRKYMEDQTYSPMQPMSTPYFEEKQIHGHSHSHPHDSSYNQSGLDAHYYPLQDQGNLYYQSMVHRQNTYGEKQELPNKIHTGHKASNLDNDNSSEGGYYEESKCQWGVCKLEFDNIDQLVKHITEDHIGVNLN